VARVDQHGNVLDVLVQSRRNALAAIKFFRRLLKALRYVPRVLVTDTLASCGPAHRVVMPSVQHLQSKYRDSRAENSHQPTRQRERAMKRFTAPRHAHRFLSAFSHISPDFRPRRHLLSATRRRHEMADRFTVWNQITGVSTAAHSTRTDTHNAPLHGATGQSAAHRPTAFTCSFTATITRRQL
jgi:putative transposase